MQIIPIMLLVAALSVSIFPAYGCQSPTTTSESSTTTTTSSSPGKISYEYHYIYTDTSLCYICHTGDTPLLTQPDDHTGRADDSCLDAGCHELSE